jgi:hypothetical protein
VAPFFTLAKPKNPVGSRGIFVETAHLACEMYGVSREMRSIFPVFVIWKNSPISTLPKSKFVRVMEVGELKEDGGWCRWETDDWSRLGGCVR